MQNFAFFGTPFVARDTLEALMEAEYIPRVVVTSPDAPQGRGQTIQPSATRAFAMDKGLPTLAPEKLDDEFLQQLAQYKCEFGIVVAYGKILPQKVLDAFPFGLVNVHYSLLPKYRGAAPVEHALLQGEQETGVTIQKMALAMDAGDILAQCVYSIPDTATARELRPQLIEVGAELLIETIPGYLEGTISPVEQVEKDATFAPKISKAARLLSSKTDPLINWRTYRALAESPGVHMFATKEDKRIRVKVARASYEKDELKIERIVPEGKQEQDAENFLKNGWEFE